MTLSPVVIAPSVASMKLGLLFDEGAPTTC
jgi:hypothetical protein